MNRILQLLFTAGFVFGFAGFVHAQTPVANFGGTPVSNCAPLIVQFTDSSTNSPTSWYWILGNGNTSTAKNPSATYTVAGTYTVTLVTANASGADTFVRTSYISVVPSPTVNFRANDSTPGCGSKTISITNLSSSNSTGTTTYYWDFGDGVASTSQTPPSHTYTTPGVYNVTLVVTNSQGCTKTLVKTGYITVLAKPVAGFTASNVSACSAPVTTSFTNTSTGATSYAWDFGDGGTSTVASPSHTYNTGGTYTVRLIAESAGGCKDTLRSTSLVNIGSLAAGFTSNVTAACTNNPVYFTNTTTPGGGSVMWYFGDGTTSTLLNPVHSYATAGTYTVKLVVIYSNCADSVSKTITISSGAVSAFTGSPLVACAAPLNVTFTNSTSGASRYLWIFGDGSTDTSRSPTHTYSATGNYTVRLVSYSTNGCTDTLTRTSYVNIETPVVVISGSPYVGCPSATSSFSAVVTSLIPVASYSWNFGDGTTGTGGPGISHVYTTSGTYTLTVTVTTTTGCVFTATQNVVVGSRVTPSFTASPNPVCYKRSVYFTNTTTGSASSYIWLFGDGGTSVQTSPTYIYGAPGSYTAKLVAINNGCTDTFVSSTPIVINPPKADFSASYSCANRKEFKFINKSIGATSYAWNFGDGGTSTADSPTHAYASYGSYTVRLIATSSVTGCIDTFFSTVSPFALDPNFTGITSMCRGSYNYFNAVPGYSSYYWDFGDGVTGFLPYNTNHYNLNPGTYTVKLVVRDGLGCADSLTRPNYVQVTAPAANFSYSVASGCNNLTVNFTDNSVASTGLPINTRQWNFGDGTSISTTSATVSHTYTGGGSYSVTLSVVDAGGCSDFITKPSIITIRTVKAGFTSQDTLSCRNVATRFTNTSAGTGTLLYSWNFGDGTTSTAANPTHAYASTGNYTVKLIVVDPTGCSDTLTKTNYINVSTVQSGFTMSDSVGACPTFTVSFTNTSVGAVAYQWRFGNGGTSTITNPSAAYTTSGTFPISLIAINSSGCRDTARDTLVVNSGPTGSFVYTPVAGCGPLSVAFNATSSGTTSLTYDFGDGITNTTTSNSITYVYNQPGIFHPILVLRNSNGCTTFVTGADSVVVIRAFAGFRATPDTACAGIPVQFTDTSRASSGSVTSRAWSFGDGGTSAVTNPTHSYASAGTYTVRLVIGTAIGCNDTTYRTVQVAPRPLVAVSGKTICQNDSVQLTATGAATYVWSPAATLSCVNCANPFAKPAATIIYRVIGASTVGCKDTTTATVTVNPVPTVYAGIDQTICSGTSATLTATGAATYSWSPSTGLSATTGSSVTASPTVTTTYAVVGTTALGCRGTDSVVINVTPVAQVSVTPNSTICAGNSQTLTASGATSYVWSPSTGLSATTGATVTATPAATTTYVVTGTSNGCTDTAMTTVTVLPVPSVTVAGTGTICSGGNTTLTASGAATYSWSPATGLSATTGSVVTASPAATTTYTIVGTSATCTHTITKTITVNPLPSVNAGADVAACRGASVTLTATGATAYVWSPATGLSATGTATTTASPTTTTTYTVTGTDANGCVNSDAVVVTINPLPTISAGGNQFICPGDSVILNATGGNTYVWSPGATLSCTTCANPKAKPLATTIYTVIGTSALGCVDSAKATVTVNSKPTVTVAGTTSICIGSSTTLTASGANTYSWNPASGIAPATGAIVTANPVVTTTYQIIGTSGVGCADTILKTITVNPLPIVDAGNDTGICLGASATLRVTGAVSYVWSPAATLSGTTTSTVTATPAVTTMYRVTGTDANGCINRDSVRVTVNALPSVSAGLNTSICPGGSATIIPTGAVSYVWTANSTLSCTACASTVATPTTTTTYIVTGTDNNGCTDTGMVTVSVNSTPTVTVAGTTSICTGSSTTLTASGANTFSWSPATGLSATTGATVTATPSATTTYTVTGTSGVGCTATKTFTVTVNPLPSVNAGLDKSICAGASATLTATGATTYAWSPGTGLSAATGTSVTASPSATTTYTVTGTDANGCVNTDAVIVTVNPLPVVSAGANTSICPGGTTTLTATGAASYVWSPGGSLSCTACASTVATPSGTTTYTVTGTSTNGCIATSSVTVSVNSRPSVSVAGTTTICAGGNTTLTASGATTFSWSPATGLSATTGATVTANPATTTTYTVTGTSGVGCTGTTTVTVTVNPLPVVSAGADVAICAGASTTLAASGASTYVWTPTAGLSSATVASPTASPIITTTYTVTGTTGGCSASANVTVTVNPLPGVSAGSSSAVCPGGSATLTASGAASYVWSPGATLSCTICAVATATPATTTTYTVVGTSGAGCTASSSVTVTVNPIPNVSVSGGTSVCIGSATTLTASGASTYVWSPGTGLSSTTGSSVTASPATTTTYTVTGTSGVGCTGTTTVTVVVNPLPVVSVDTPQTACLNTPVQLTAKGASTYAWSPASGLSCTTCANPIATPAATTIYTVIGTDNNGCIATAQTTLTILPLPAVSAGPDISSCKLNSVTLNATGAVSYIWTPATSLSCTTCANPVATPTATTAYVVSGTGTNGCVASDTVNVTLYAQPPVNAGPDQTICAGTSAQLQASGASTYIWSPAATLSCATCANPLSTPSVTSAYLVSGTDINGCRDSDMVTVTVIQHNPVSIDTGGDFCVGGSIQLHAEGGDSYTWSPAAGLSCIACPDPLASPVTTTTYTVIIRQGQCFADTLTTTVVIRPLPTVNAGPDQSIILGSTAQIRVTGDNISRYSWTPPDNLSCTDCPNPVASPSKNTAYTVVVVSEFGCTASDNIVINVRCDGSQIWLPNTFTPNGDFHNDRFYPHGKGISQINRFRIYNRWGELMFDQANLPINDKDAGWDGTFKNQLLKPDVFVWVLNATCTNGEPLELKGDISLIR